MRSNNPNWLLVNTLIMNSKISEKDKKTWDEFLSNNQKLPDKDNIQNKSIVKNQIIGSAW